MEVPPSEVTAALFWVALIREIQSHQPDHRSAISQDERDDGVEEVLRRFFTLRCNTLPCLTADRVGSHPLRVRRSSVIRHLRKRSSQAPQT